MSYTFTNAVLRDPLISHIQKKLGCSYLKDLALDWPEGDTLINVSKNYSDTDFKLVVLSSEIGNVLSQIPSFSAAILGLFQVHAANPEK